MIGNQHTAQRIVNAENNFVETLQRCGEIDKDTAEKVMRFYLYNKLAKLDAVNGTIKVKHGAFLDKQSIVNAVGVM